MKLSHTLLLIFCITFLACNIEPVDLPQDDPVVVDNPDDDSDNDGGEDDNDDDDDSDNDNDELILIKKIVDTYEGETFTCEFTYDDNKLLRIDESGDYVTVFTYEDGELVRYDNIRQGVLISYVTVAYDSNNKLSSYTEFYTEGEKELNGTALKFVVIFNDNDTITIETYSGNHDSQTTGPSYSTLKVNNGNILEEVDDDRTLTYEFDSKNSIYKNIYNIEMLNIISLTEFGPLIFGSTHNVTKITDNQDFFGSTVEVFEYTYNDKNYPETAETYYDGEYIGTLEYFYE